MIHGFLVISDTGKSRLARFYDEITAYQQLDIINKLLFYVSSRSKTASNFVFHNIGIPDIKIIYRLYAKLYFIVLADDAENELACLDLIQCFVEALDIVFNRVAESDLLYGIDNSNWVLDEMICGGIIVNVNKDKVVEAYRRALSQ